MSEHRRRRRAEEEARRREIERRRRIIRERKRRQRIMRQRMILAGIGALVLVVGGIAVGTSVHKKNEEKQAKKIEEQKKQEAAAEEENVLQMVAVGDNLIHDAVINSGKEQEWNFDFLYENIKEDIEKADLASVNQETPFIKEHDKAAGYPDFATPTEVGDALVKAGFDIVTQATEHAFDRESDGITDSVEFWEKSYPKIVYLGIHGEADEARYQVIKKKNFKVAVMNYSSMVSENHSIPEEESYMVDTYSEKNIKEDLAKAEKEAESEKDASEEEEQKVASDSEVADVSEDTEEKESETPEESEPEIRVNMEGIQEQISKGIRDIFGGKTQEEKEEFTEESDDMINAAGITKENEIPEEIIKSDASQEEPENVPQLEAEPEKPGEAPVAVPVESVQEEKKEPDFSATIKMPELNIPASMKNMELSKAPKVEDVAETKLSMDSFKTSGTEFNLEDTILAAASAQGIEIPKEETQPEVKEPEKISETEPEVAIKTQKIADELEEPDFLSGNLEDTDIEDVKAEPAKTIIDEEKTEEPVAVPKEFIEDDEDEVTEEDLRRAEEEFLYGPAGNSDVNLEDIDDTEPEQLVDVAKEEEEQPEPLTEEEELERFIESIQPKDETDPRDIVPREKELTDDEKQLFTYFVKIPGMKEQLVDTLCDVQMAAADKTSKTGNIIVMGGKECGKTRLISGLVPAICKELNLEASKVAYVFADQINGKNIYKIFSKLSGGFLVIENANQLTQETVEMLDKAMEVNTDGLTIIVEDEKIGMRKLIAKYPKFAKKFTSMINIPVFTNDELVNFARVYTKENGYTIDQMGMLALYNLIGINQKEDSPMNIGAVKELIDSAIAKSQGGIRKFKRNVSKKRIDRDGYIVLYEKDFSK